MGDCIQELLVLVGRVRGIIVVLTARSWSAGDNTCADLVHTSFHLDLGGVDQGVHVLVEGLVTKLLKLKSIFIITDESLGLNLSRELLHGLLVCLVHSEESSLDVVDG